MSVVMQTDILWYIDNGTNFLLSNNPIFSNLSSELIKQFQDIV
jgi:hypothetical protein